MENANVINCYLLYFLAEGNSAAYKEALFGVCTLFLELARLDVDSESIRCIEASCSYSSNSLGLFICSTLLEDCKFSPERAKHFITAYLVRPHYGMHAYLICACSSRRRKMYCVQL